MHLTTFSSVMRSPHILIAGQAANTALIHSPAVSYNISHCQLMRNSSIDEATICSSARTRAHPVRLPQMETLYLMCMKRLRGRSRNKIYTVYPFTGCSLLCKVYSNSKYESIEMCMIDHASIIGVLVCVQSSISDRCAPSISTRATTCHCDIANCEHIMIDSLARRPHHRRRRHPLI